jgi:carboxymethylenebutenolidase
MKNTILLFAALAIGFISSAQTPACCVKPPAGSGLMAMAKTEAFMKAHDAPEPFYYAAQRGSDITFNTLDGKKGRAYFLPSPGATVRTLIIFHEWWGLNDYIRREADRWQDSLGNVDIYAIDLYDGVVATTADEASKLSSSRDIRRTDVLIKGLLAKIGRDNQIATLGWCMGGSYAFRAAVLAEKQAAGCVMYYGFPEKDAKNITPLQTDVLYIWAARDKFITRDMVTAFESSVKASGHNINVETYDADHAFANPSNPHFDAAAAAAAQSKALPFLRSHLVL